MEEVEPRPAATVVLAREGPASVEVLMLLRDRNLAFNAGSWVFPGGKIDRQDYAPDRPDLEYQAAINAAIRETREEAGIHIERKHLIHTAHWTTPAHLPRRYSTWFFLCPIFEQVEVTIDDGEIRDYRWVAPSQALEEVEASGFKVPRPTRTTLEDLRPYTSLDALLHGVSRQRIRVFPENSPYYRPLEMGFTDGQD